MVPVLPYKKVIEDLQLHNNSMMIHFLHYIAEKNQEISEELYLVSDLTLALSLFSMVNYERNMEVTTGFLSF